jgi:hypothetical protein
MNEHVSPISLDLFKRIDDYIADIRSGDVHEKMVLDGNTAIYIFYKNFFFQFFDFRFGNDSVTGFDESAKEQATRLRYSLHGVDKGPALALICQFEYFCDLLKDLVGGQYFASRDEFLLFHKQFIPELLQDIGIWATAEGLNELARRDQQALSDYRAAVNSLRST